MDEQYYEKLFNIKTCGDQKGFNDSIHYNRYEPTSYIALNSLFKEYKLTGTDNIIDFGCGKGRLNFYINYFYNINVIGVEMNTYFYKEALNNKNDYLKKNKKNKAQIEFLNCFAENYSIRPIDNIFYFFNPFSIQIFMKIISNILLSLDSYERTIDIILYYPSEDYIYYLENNTPFRLIADIKLDNIYTKDSRQRFLIYQIAFIK